MKKRITTGAGGDSGGSKGLYVKFIDLSQPKATSQQVAEYVQDIHFRGFTDGTDNTWKIVDERSSSDQEFTRSALDMYDAKAKYRVLSVVVCDSRSALQITVHDYLCEQYSSSQDPFVQLEYSITRSLASH